MKFILTITICSFLNGECATPITIPTIHNSWSNCVQDAIIKSQELLSKMDNNKINQYQIATKFSCKELREI